MFQEFLSKLKDRKLKIAVVGDSMVDEYYQVEANRVSPEFPIPVMRSDFHTPTYSYPGGAANVALQLTKFNVESYLVSVIDMASNAIFNEHSICTDFCKVLPNLVVPRKKRLYNKEFPLCRWDVEQTNMGLSDETLFKYQKQLLDKTLKLEPDVVILSDYGKGLFSKCCKDSSVNGNLSKEMWIWSDKLSLESGKHPWITIVDPKNGHLIEWEGCTVFKPNKHEAFQLTKEIDDEKQLRHIKNVTNCESVIVTHGGEKVVGVDKELWSIEKNYKEAKNPIGAGDCFVAMLAMAYPFFLPKEAARIAFEIGAIYVNKHDRCISPQIILNTKTITPEELSKLDSKLVFANGCFDILHSGHIKLLRFAKEQGDKLVVALNDDASIKRLKGDNRPIKPLKERIAVLEAMEMVDYIITFSEDTPLEIIKKIKPWCIVKGKDYNKEDVVGFNEVEGRVILCPLVEGQSTSKYVK